MVIRETFSSRAKGLQDGLVGKDACNYACQFKFGFWSHIVEGEKTPTSVLLSPRGHTQVSIHEVWVCAGYDITVVDSVLCTRTILCELQI